MRNQISTRWACNCHRALLRARAISSVKLRTSRAPQPRSPPAKRQGFFDYALGKINPHGNDYGASMESARNAAVENTIDDLYFWSNAVTLLLLSGLVAIVLFSGAPRTSAKSSRPLLSHSYGTAA